MIELTLIFQADNKFKRVPVTIGITSVNVLRCIELVYPESVEGKQACGNESAELKSIFRNPVITRDNISNTVWRVITPRRDRLSQFKAFCLKKAQGFKSANAAIVLLLF